MSLCVDDRLVYQTVIRTEQDTPPAAGPNQFCPDPARKPSTNLYDTYHCCVYIEKLLMMDRGTI